MKKAITIFAAALLTIPVVSQVQKTNYLTNIYDFIENLDVFELNQEEGHAFYRAEKQISLNGEWKFLFANTPEGIPQTFFQPKFNDSKWSKIKVPSNWEMQGFGDPLFRNVQSPFKSDVPNVPREYNPTGAYRRTFTVPSDWSGQQVFLRLEKAQSASFVWINGQEVGYNEGGQEPAEYDVTPFLKPGKNLIAVHVVKYSDGYYLEGQDYWRLAGIFDDVTLYATPKTRIFDWFATTDLDDQYLDATLNLAIDVKSYAGAMGNHRVRATLLDPQGKAVKEMTTETFASETGKKSFKLSSFVQNPAKWTSETPTLYGLRLELLDEKGCVEQKIDSRIGFKETEIRHQTFYLNGQPIKVNATNSHMQHPKQGHFIDEATIRKDMEILKQHNFNAVRTSHYPPTNRYLELADEYGLYIIDEAGTEAHATEGVSWDNRFLGMYKERVRQMVLRDRNHPCVLFWSAGNESGEGPNITEVVKEGKSLDPTRYFMYGGNAYSHPGEEIIGPRYPTPYELEMNTAMVPEEEDPRPSFMDEYLSVAGNAGGALDEYWSVIRRHPRLMGGAIWDFVSPGITEHIRPLKDSSPYDTPVHLMGGASIKSGVLNLNGHDQWVEVYRQDNVELSGKALTISFDVRPGELAGMYNGSPYITKGSHQFGVIQPSKEKLRFYLHTGIMHRLGVDVPADWQDHWHHVTASWNGQEMKLFIDGKLLGTESTAQTQTDGNTNRRAAMNGTPTEKGILSNFPFAINLGRIAGSHGQEPNTLYTADAQMDNVAIYDKFLNDGEGSAAEAVLYLTFDRNGDEGTFYTWGATMRTYGSIWPDRTVQPEMKQMKWTTQPVSLRWIDETKGEVEVTNRQYFTDLSKYASHWKLQADGDILQEGDITLNAQPQRTAVVRIPMQKPTIVPGKEYRITISTALKTDEVWAKAGHEVAWDQLELTSWNLPAQPVVASSKNIKTEENANEMHIFGDGFRYTFSKQTGDLQQIEMNGQKLLKAPLTFNLWRAPLANESDSWDSYRINTGNTEGFGSQIANLYYAKGMDSLTTTLAVMDLKRAEGYTELFVRQQLMLGGKTIAALDPYIRGIVMAGFTTEYTYRFADDGTVTIRTHVSPQGKLPELLPRIGLTTSVSKQFDRITWYGRGPEENYPDRKTGYQVGVWSKQVDAMYEPYIMPQDHALRTDLRYVELRNNDGQGIRIGMNERFNFNAYPFTTDNLTKSNFTYQLQRQTDQYTLNLDYRTTGVGCTCVYVLSEYQTKPEAYDRVITISPVK